MMRQIEGQKKASTKKSLDDAWVQRCEANKHKLKFLSRFLVVTICKAE